LEIPEKLSISNAEKLLFVPVCNQLTRYKSLPVLWIAEGACTQSSLIFLSAPLLAFQAFQHLIALHSLLTVLFATVDAFHLINVPQSHVHYSVQSLNAKIY